MRSVLEGMGEAFVLLGHDFTVLDINAEGLKLERRGRDEIVGQSHWDVWPNTTDSAVGRLYQHAMADRQPVSLEHRYQWPDGREHWIDMRAYPVPDGGQGPIAVFGHSDDLFLTRASRIEAMNARQVAKGTMTAVGTPRMTPPGPSG